MAATRKHTHHIELPVKPETAFAALYTPGAICHWWKASKAIVIPRSGGVWAAAWGAEDDPDYISAATIEAFDPPNKMRLVNFQYYARSGEPPFPTGNITTEFTVEASPGGSILRVIQDGFPRDSVADEFYHACEIGWRTTFEYISEYFSKQSNETGNSGI